MSTTFLERHLSLTFKLGNNRTFASSGNNTLTVSGVRARCSISDAGGPDMGLATVRVYGLTPSHLRDLCTTVRLENGKPLVTLNYLTISVGDKSIPVASYSQVFQGQVTLATIDMESPESVLVCTCSAGGFEASYQTPAHSYAGAVDVYSIMQSLAGLAVPPLTFEGNNTHVMLNQQYLWGSLRDQIKQAAEAAGVKWTVDKGTLAIWPPGGARTAVASIPTLSYRDGSLIGYPTNWSYGAAFKCIFNPQLSLGTLVDCDSTLDFAKGRFSVADISHELDSLTPGGQWFTYFHGLAVGLAG